MIEELSSTQLTKLAEPFDPADIEWRVQQAGTKKNGEVWARVLAYVTNRAIMKRLDEVVGPGRWCNHYEKAPDGGILCGISVFVNETLGWVVKWDGAENTDIEQVKGGLSNSMKRAAVQWGIGRYLYNLEAGYADITENGSESGKTKDGTWFKWNPPKLPKWAMPEGTASTKRAKPAEEKEKDETSPEVLENIKALGAAAPDDAVITIRREEHNLKEYVRSNWKDIQADPSLAKLVVRALEKVG